MARSVETGLVGASEVGAGECWEITPDTRVKRQQYWNPVEIARSNVIENIDEAVKAVRQTTQACVWAWAHCFPRIVHLLSGELDSSIVLSCLNTAPVRPRVTCLIYFDTSSPAGDEREYARATAASTGFELVEAPHGLTGGGLEPMLAISRSVNSTVCLNARSPHARLLVAEERGVHAERGVSERAGTDDSRGIVCPHLIRARCRAIDIILFLRCQRPSRVPSVPESWTGDPARLRCAPGAGTEARRCSRSEPSGTDPAL